MTHIQSIHNCIPETNHVSNVYNVAAILCLQFMVHIILLPMLNVLYFYVVLPEVCVQSPTWLFSVVPSLRAIQVGSAGVFRMIKRYFQLHLLFLASILLLNTIYALFLLHDLDVNNFLVFISYHICVS